MGHTLGFDWCTMKFPSQKWIFPFLVGWNFVFTRHSPCKAYVYFEPVLVVCMLSQSQRVHTCTSSVISTAQHFLRTKHLPLALTIFPNSLLHKFLSLDVRRLIKIFHLGLCASNSPTYLLYSCEFLWIMIWCKKQLLCWVLSDALIYGYSII